MCARSRTRIVVWACIGDSGGSSRWGGIEGAPVEWRWAEFQRGPPSESGEGMGLEDGAITVVAVLADEALESEKDPGVGSCGAASRGISCCGCVPPDDGCEDEDDGGGEGSRAVLSLAERFDCFAALFSCA
jgi:hypothetical protein